MPVLYVCVALVILEGWWLGWRVARRVAAIEPRGALQAGSWSRLCRHVGRDVCPPPPAGDWDRAWDIFETAYPVDGDEFPPLEDLLAWDPEEDVKAERRARELALQVRGARARWWWWCVCVYVCVCVGRRASWHRRCGGRHMGVVVWV